MRENQLFAFFTGLGAETTFTSDAAGSASGARVVPGLTGGDSGACREAPSGWAVPSRSVRPRDAWTGSPRSCSGRAVVDRRM